LGGESDTSQVSKLGQNVPRIITVDTPAGNTLDIAQKLANKLKAHMKTSKVHFSKVVMGGAFGIAKTQKTRKF